MEEDPAIVIDNGAATCKAGWSGEDSPRVVIPTVVGEVKQNLLAISSDIYLGDEALNKRRFLKLKGPISNGAVNDWEAMKKIWHAIFYWELRKSPEDQPVLLCESPCSPRRNRERTAEIMFEDFTVPRLYLANQATLSLIESGRLTGTVLSSGYDTCYAVSIYDATALSYASLRSDIGGKQLTDHLASLIHQQIYSCYSSEHSIIADIKEKMCYVALNYDHEIQPGNSCKKEYELPEGAIISVDTQRFICPEAFFQPALMQLQVPPVQEILVQAINRCTVDLRSELSRNIVLSGGNTMFPGFKERIEVEVKAKMEEREVKVVGVPERKSSTWLGGSIVSSLSQFEECWVTKSEYAEFGASIIHRKCQF